MQTIEILEREHRLILRAIGVAEIMRTYLFTEQGIEEEDLADLLEFFQNFAEHTHCRKEEFLLIPWLKNHGIPISSFPSFSLELEHDHYRRRLQDLTTLLGKKSFQAPNLETLLGKMCRDLRLHMAQESKLIFSVAQKSHLDDQELCDAFHEATPNSEALEAHYSQLIDRLHKRYPVRSGKDTREGGSPK
jgi:hemerythrin-like domain-containing protein